MPPDRSTAFASVWRPVEAKDIVSRYRVCRDIPSDQRQRSIQASDIRRVRMRRLDSPVVPDVPVKGLALILGIDRFMSEARAITNLIGNGVAAIVISRWEKSLDIKALNKALDKSMPA